MKLLLDENLSRRLVPFLQNEFPDSTQVALIGLERADDREIWQYAKSNDYVIVTRDADFSELSAVQGHPPQVLWLRTLNQSKSASLGLLLKNRAWFEEVLREGRIGCIELGQETPA
jgi:predicted nuclease of predicted toxin-antitoxin system